MFSSHHYELAFIYGAAFFLAALYQLGTSPLVDFIMRIITPGSQEHRTAQRALNDKKRQLQGISAQDSFAAWARLQRQIEAEQKKVDGQQREHQQRNALLGMAVSLILRLLNLAAWAFVLYAVFFKIKVNVNGEIFGAVITPPVLFVLCFFASVRITDLLF